ncbi:MAG: hypothetical protein WAX77_05905 [Methylococcaceae bacterium]
MTTISIEVDEKIARTFFQASADEKHKFQVLLNLRLKELLSASNRPLADIMNEMGNYAQTQGMNAELLASLFNEK